MSEENHRIKEGMQTIAAGVFIIATLIGGVWIISSELTQLKVTIMGLKGDMKAMEISLGDRIDQLTGEMKRLKENIERHDELSRDELKALRERLAQVEALLNNRGDTAPRWDPKDSLENYSPNPVNSSDRVAKFENPISPLQASCPHCSYSLA